jgi:hypothetical protein
LLDNKAKNVTRVGAKRQAYADLVRALAHAEGQDTVNAYGSKAHGKRSEKNEKKQVKALGRNRTAQKLVYRRDLVHRHAPVERCDLFADR